MDSSNFIYLYLVGNLKIKVKLRNETMLLPEIVAKFGHTRNSEENVFYDFFWINIDKNPLHFEVWVF